MPVPSPAVVLVIAGGLLLLLSRRAAAAPPFGVAGLGSGRRRFLAAVESALGTPYVWGAESYEEGGFDCSGLIAWALVQAGLRAPGYRPTAHGLYRELQAVQRDDLQPGDLVFFAQRAGAVSHVAVWLGPGRLVSATRTGDTVREHALWPGVAGYGRLTA